MAVTFRTLRSFVVAVESRSLSAAAKTQRVSQPALSQHIAALEDHFRQKLLLRSSAGVSPTPGGQALYRHAVQMLDHMDHAERDVARLADGLVGTVSVGLATYSSTSLLATPLLRSVRDRHPDVSLVINDNFGFVLSEAVMAGRMDMAIIYTPRQTKGVLLQPLLVEELFLIAPSAVSLPRDDGDTIGLAEIAAMDLFLPGRTHYLRRLIEAAFAQIRSRPQVRAEIESTQTLRVAIEEGLGATILPKALARTFSGATAPVVRRIVDPPIETTVSLCTSDHLPLSEPAQAVQDILTQLAEGLLDADDDSGIRALGAAG